MGFKVTQEIELNIPVRVDYVQLVRAVVGSLAATNPGLSAARISDLRLVVSEALTNAIRAQEKNSVAERLTILCKLTDSAIEVKVMDKAKGFEIRWFTPGSEVKLCGHATLASAAVLFNEFDYSQDKIVFDSLST